jgi:hypothetical protein
MSESPPTAAPVCYRHPSRETWVRCTRCERPICPDCMRDASVGHQCPECVNEGRRTQRSARTAFGGSAAGRAGYVTKTLIALNLIAAVIGVALYGVDTLIPQGGLFGRVTEWQWFGGVLGPSVVLNTDHGQALWAVGRALEGVLGRARFAALYLLAGIGGNVAAFVIDPNAPSAGASTAIFGLFGAYFVIARRLGGDTRQIVTVLVINLVITFTLPGVSWAGHIGGLVTGALVGAVLAYAPRDRRTLIQAVGCAIVLAALIGVTLAKVASVTA